MISEALALCSFEGPLRAFFHNFPVAIARGKHLFPFRTEPLSPSAPMVLGPQGPGRVGRRRFLLSFWPRLALAPARGLLRPVAVAGAGRDEPAAARAASRRDRRRRASGPASVPRTDRRTLRCRPWGREGTGVAHRGALRAGGADLLARLAAYGCPAAGWRSPAAGPWSPAAGRGLLRLAGVPGYRFDA